MGKFDTVQIKFDKDYLNKLTEDVDSGVSKQNCKYHIALHPAQFGDFGQSIKDELGRKKAKYDDIFQGIMLGYEKLKVKSDLGVIGIDNCYVHVDIQGDFFVFRPEIGMILKGIVTRTTKDHVGCLVYSTFNISLPKPDNDDEYWLGTKAAIQSDVLFKIIFVDLTARLPYIRGELLSILNDTISTDPLNFKKNKKIKFEASSDQENSIPTESTQLKKKKRKKKHIEDQESIENIEINGEDYVEETVTKKRKRSSFESGHEGESFVSKPKKKHKKSHKKDGESLEEPSENLKVKNEDFWKDISGNITSSIEPADNDKVVNNSTEKKSKKKHKKSSRKHSISFEESPENLKVENEDFWEEVSKNITSSIKTGDNDQVVNNTPEKSKKKHKKSSGKHSVSFEESPENLKVENEDFWEEVSKNITSSIKTGDNYQVVNNTPEKSNKKHKKSSGKHSVSFEDSQENLKVENEDFWEEVSKNITSSIKTGDNDQVVNNTPEKSKKKHKKSSPKHSKLFERSPENLEVGDKDFWEKLSGNNTSIIEPADNDQLVSTSPEKSKNKHKKSSQKHLESFEESSENLKVENEDFWNETSQNIKSSITSRSSNNVVGTIVGESKKKDKKSHSKNDKSAGRKENDDIWDSINENLKSSIKSERDDKKVDNNTEKKTKEKHKKAQNKDIEALEKKENVNLKNEIFWEEVSENLKVSIKGEKSKKKDKKASKKDKEVEKNLDINLQDLLEDEMNRVNRKHNKKKKQKPDSDDQTMLEKKEKRKEKKRKQQEEENLSMVINSLFSLNNSPSKDDVTSQSKKKHKQNLDNNDEAIESIEIKREKQWEETTLGESKKKTTEKPDNHTDITLRKKDKRKEKKKMEAQGDGVLENIEVKTEIKKEKNWEEEIPGNSQKDIQKHNFDEGLLKKQEKRREKKKKNQEQNDSLESLDIKSLFEGGSMNLNSSFSQSMANAEDRGKKRKRSNSVSQQVYLETIKLEVDSEMERITSGKKRKKSKSFST